MASTQSETTVVACPGCGSRLSVPKSMMGQRARCAGCSMPFTIPAPTNKPATKPKEAAAAVPEHVGFDCRVCNTRLFARTEDVGGKLKCPDCGALTIIPPPPPPKPKNMPAALEGEQYELWEPDEQPLPSQLIADQPKTVLLKCRRCDTVMHPMAKLVGQPIRCPDCGTTNLVPPPPKPVVRPSVLAPDALTPRLDPAAHPGERPLVLPPSAKMLHEEQFAEEYQRELEKSQRTGKPMTIDRRGRPIMPRWPLVTGVLPILFTGFVPLVWIFASAGFACALWLLLTGIVMSGQGYGALGGMPIFAAGCVSMMICSAGTYTALLQIVMESSEGNRTIHHWPSLPDWFVSLLYLGVALPFSAALGWVISFITTIAADQHWVALANGASIFIFFPIVMLSQLDINSPAGLVSVRILTSLKKCPFSWMFFYFENAVMVASCVGATYYVDKYYPRSILWLVPLYVAALILFARLIGRLAWRLAEAMPLADETD